MIITLYLPHKIKYIEYGYLSLSGNYQNLSEDNERKEIALVISDEFSSTLKEDSIGLVSEEDDSTPRKCDWIKIKTGNNLIFENFMFERKIVSMKDVTIVYYNSSDIHSSSMLKSIESSTNSLQYFIHTISKSQKQNTNLSWGIKLIYILLSILTPILNYFSVNLERLSSFISNNFDFRSLFLDQLLLRTKHLQTLQQLNYYQKENKILFGHIFFIIAADIIIGVVSVYFITSNTSADELHLNFLLAAKKLAGYILGLLHLLQGVPAGLKLNQPLSETLSNFFSYIVYLLLFYLELAYLPLNILANLFVYIGFLGVSFQAALLADFLKLSTLHIYCLYIYAARIQMLQMSLLGSHWRGFRGKKWNPLKNRIDSREDFASRPSLKIFTVVIFTFVIFLLPTTTLYYAVFLALRLVLLGLQGLTVFLIWALNSNPLYIVWLSFIGSPSVNGDISLELDHQMSSWPNNPLVLNFNLGSSSMEKVLKTTLKEDVFPECPKTSLSYMWNSIIFARQLL